MTDDSKALVIRANAGPLELSTAALPDVRTILRDEQRKRARQMALAVVLEDNTAILQFGDDVTMSGVAKGILENTKMKEVRGTPVEAVLADLQLAKTQFNPANVLSPQVKFLVSKAAAVKQAIQAYRENFDNMQTKLDEIEARLQRSKDMQIVGIRNLQQLQADGYSLYDQFTVLEASYLYLLKRMIDKYQADKAALQSEDLQAGAKLADLADYIGMVDRNAFETHVSRARVIQLCQQIRVMIKSDEELWRMLGMQIRTAMPVFRANMAVFIELCRSERALKVLEDFRTADRKLAQKMDDAIGAQITAVANASEASVEDVALIVASYEKLAANVDQVVEIHQRGIQARAEAAARLDKVMAGMQQKITSFNPSVMPQLPADVKDVPLTLDAVK